MSRSHASLSRVIHLTFSSALAFACLLAACDEPVDDETEHLEAELEPADEPEPRYLREGSDREDLVVELESKAALYVGEEHPTATVAPICGWYNGGACAWCGESGCIAWACNDGSSGGCCVDKYGNCD